MDNMLTVGVVPVLVGPLQALMAILPGLLVALGGAVLAMFKPSAIKKLALLLWSQKLFVVSAVAITSLAVYFWPAIFPPRGAGKWEASSADWPVWRGSPQRRGTAPSPRPDPAGGDVQWRFTTGGIKAFYCSPAAVGNRIYVTGANYVPPIKNSGAIYSIDADTGRLVWKYDANGYRATFSSPVLSGKYLVVGEGLHLTTDARIVCLDVEASERAGVGVMLWSFRTASHVESSPCITDGKVYVGAGDDGLYCLALDAGPAKTAKVIWHVKGERYRDCEPSPVVMDGRVYMGLGEGGKAVICLDAATGKEIWRQDAPFPVFGSPAVSDGKVVVAMGVGNYVNSAEDIAAGIRRDMLRQGSSAAEIARAVRGIRPVGRVWCLDAATGRIIWKFDKLERTVLGAPAIADGKVWAGSRDGFLYCLSLSDGRLIDKFNARGPIVSGPAVTDKHVYVVTQAGMLYGLDRSSGQAVWSVNLNSATMSSPTVARGHVYVGTNTNGLLCVGVGGQVKAKPLWSGPGGGPGKAGRADGSLPPERAGQAWSYKPQVNGSPATIDAPMAWMDGVLYAGLNAIDGTAALAALAVGDMARATGPATVKWTTPAKNPIFISPAATERLVLFVDGKPGQAGRALHCLDSKTGREIWQHPIDPAAGGQFVITRRMVFVADRADGLTCLDLAGRQIWSNSDGPVTGEPLPDDDGVLFVVQGSPARLLALDGPTGERLWQAELPAGVTAGVTAGPVRIGMQLWLASKTGAMVRSLLTGRGIATVTTGAETVAIAATDRGILLLSEDGKVFQVPTAAASAASKMEEANKANAASKTEEANKAGAASKAGAAIKTGKTGPATRTHTASRPDAGSSRPALWPALRSKVLIDRADPAALMIPAGDVLLYCDGTAIRNFDLRAGTSSLVRKLYPKWQGRITAPPLLVKSHILLATEKTGLICLKPKKN